MCTGHYDQYVCGHAFLAWTTMCATALSPCDANSRLACGVWIRDVASTSRTKCEECRAREALKRKREEGGDKREGKVRKL